MIDIRARLLEAAARVYAETGYRGATTRRIAQEADVNEITLFRHFGSKDALILEALRCASDGSASALPSVPSDPEHELHQWCRACFDRLYASRALVRKVFGEVVEHPEISRFAKQCPSSSATELREYVRRLQEQGRAHRDVDPAASAAMLIGAVFADAMGRDIMTEIYPYGADEAIASYVRLFLRAIGAAAVPAEDAAAER